MLHSQLFLVVSAAGAAAVEVASRLPIHASTGPSYPPAICTPATSGKVGCLNQTKSRLGAGRQPNLSPVCSGASKLTTPGCVPVFSSNASIIADVAKYGLSSRASEVKFVAQGAGYTNLPAEASSNYVEWGDFDKYVQEPTRARTTRARRSALAPHATFISLAADRPLRR